MQVKIQLRFDVLRHRCQNTFFIEYLWWLLLRVVFFEILNNGTLANYFYVINLNESIITTENILKNYCKQSNRLLIMLSQFLVFLSLLLRDAGPKPITNEHGVHSFCSWSQYIYLLLQKCKSSYSLVIYKKISEKYHKTHRGTLGLGSLCFRAHRFI